MKKIPMILVTMTVCLGACNVQDRTCRFIPGIYVLQYHHEYAVGNDTLTIKPFGDDNYTIKRKTVYQRVTEGTLGPRETKLRAYTGLYRQNTKTVIETKSGATLVFDPANERMKWGTAEYKKIR